MLLEKEIKTFPRNLNFKCSFPKDELEERVISFHNWLKQYRVNLGALFCVFVRSSICLLTKGEQIAHNFQDEALLSIHRQVFCFVTYCFLNHSNLFYFYNQFWASAHVKLYVKTPGTLCRVKMQATTACIKVGLEAERGFPCLSYFTFVYVDLYIPYYHPVT